MAALFDVGVPANSKHLANVFETGELNEDATISKMETVQQEGSRTVKRSVVMYKLDAIIAVGYRVNSIRATQFRQWATSVLLFPSFFQRRGAGWFVKDGLNLI